MRMTLSIFFIFMVLLNPVFSDAQVQPVQKPQPGAVSITQPGQVQQKNKLVVLPKANTIDIALGNTGAHFLLQEGVLSVCRKTGSNCSAPVSIPIANGQVALQQIVNALKSLGFSEQMILDRLSIIVAQLETKMGLTISGKADFQQYLQ